MSQKSLTKNAEHQLVQFPEIEKQTEKSDFYTAYVIGLRRALFIAHNMHYKRADY